MNVIRRVRMFQVYVAQHGDEWTVTTETRVVSRYTNRERAIAAAIDLANAAAKTGRYAEVTETEGSLLKTIWTAGKDLFPSSQGKPKNSRARGTYRLPLTQLFVTASLPFLKGPYVSKRH